MTDAQSCKPVLSCLRTILHDVWFAEWFDRMPTRRTCDKLVPRAVLVTSSEWNVKNPAFWLVHWYHVTQILDSNWSGAIPAHYNYCHLCLEWTIEGLNWSLRDTTLDGLHWRARLIEWDKLLTARNVALKPLKSHVTDTILLQCGKQDLMVESVKFFGKI